MTTLTSFYHSVYFWLREGGTDEDAHKIATGCRTYLPSIPGIVTLTVGVPAGTPRDVVDNSYGVALLIEFENKVAYDVYEDHPEHLRFITECHSFWSRVQVYDAVPA
ncbi:MAG: Dabb family protein [Janthinobacterium lividum]